MTSDDDLPLDKLSYEDALKRLEEIVETLDSDEIPLESLVHRYDQGMKLLKLCQARLENAKQRIEVISLPENEQDPGEETPKAPSKKPVAKKKKRATPDKKETSQRDEIRLF